MTRRHRRSAAAVAIASLALASSAFAAFAPLPGSGAQVNDDLANSIDPGQSAGVVDTAGGTVVAGNVQLPWAAFEQRTGADAQQIFVRAFKGGQWVTQGFPASLNLDPTKEAEAPSIDFAGAGRTTPWVSWYEPNDNLPGGKTNIFASRFNAAANLWLPSGQDRSPGSQVPSLNINTDREAENPAVAGGATTAGADPVPWVAWQEFDGANKVDDQRDQIFVSRAIKLTGTTTCPAGTLPAGGAAVNGFCWQQVGIDRISRDSLTSTGATDPTLSVDPTRNAVEPDIAFTGPGDTVPWVVWYEEDGSGLGLPGNQMVFAAKAVKDPSLPGGFKWVAVGNGTAGQTNVLDTGGNANHLGSCTESADAERACSLNRDPHASAQEPRVAAGTMAPGGITSPWVTWDEEIGGGRHAIFVSRLAGDHFEVLNNGQPISNTVNDSLTPDITFSHNTPYVSWVENVNGQERAFLGHFEGPGSAPVFKLDTPGGVVRTAGGVVEQRVPVSSTCTANPFNADGAACQGSAIGTPFFLHTAAGAPQRLFSDAYLPEGATTLAATGVGAASATLNGSVNPAGAPVRVHFEFGSTTAYGSNTAAQDLGVGSAPVGVSAAVANLPASTTIHYRLVAQSDFATVVGADQVLVTAAAPPAPPAPPTPPAPPSRPAPNVPPALGIALYKPTVVLHKLAKPRKLVLHLSVSERSTVTVQLLKGKKQLKRLVTKRAGKGAFTVRLPLLGIKAGNYTVRITARDPQGLARIKTKSLHLVR